MLPKLLSTNPQQCLPPGNLSERHDWASPKAAETQEKLDGKVKKSRSKQRCVIATWRGEFFLKRYRIIQQVKMLLSQWNNESFEERVDAFLSFRCQKMFFCSWLQAFSEEAHASASRVRPDSWRAGREVWAPVMGRHGLIVLACGLLQR